MTARSQSQGGKGYDDRAYHVEEARAEIYPGYICRDMIDELSVCKCRSCTRGKLQRARVDGSNQPSTQQYSCRHAAIKKLICAEGADELKDKEYKGQTDSFANWWAFSKACPMGNVRFCSKCDDGLYSPVKKVPQR